MGGMRGQNTTPSGNMPAVLLMCKHELTQLPGVKPELAMACTLDAIKVATGF